MNVMVIRTNGTEEFHTDVPVDGVLRLLKADVPDTVNLRDGRVMFVDDAGHAKQLPDNPKATAIYHAVCRPGTTHRIVGDVAIVRDSDFE